MAQVSHRRDIFLTQRANIRTLPLDFTFRRRQQAAQDAKQTSLAASVRAGELDEGAGRKRKIETPKQPAISADAAEFADL